MGFPAYEGLADLIQSTGGVAVVLGADSTYGHLDTVDEIVLEGDTQGVIGGVPTVVVPTADLTVTMGATITVAGSAWMVRQHMRIEDGALTRVFLTELGGAFNAAFGEGYG